MASRTLISVEEYLRTSYRPDCDYVDGEVVERNLGEKDHSSLQKKILLYLAVRESNWGFACSRNSGSRSVRHDFVFPTSASHWGEPAEQIFTKPPFICIEILSPEDRWPRVQQRIDDYLGMGVPYVWVLDPATKTAYSATPTERTQQVTTGDPQDSEPFCRSSS